MSGNLGTHLIFLAVGFFLGFWGRHFCLLARASWLDRHQPNGDGTPHRRPGINRTWVSSLLALLVVGWSIYQIQVTSTRTTANNERTNKLSEEVKACQKEFNTALQVRSQLQTEDNDLAARDRTALRNWLKTLLTPPPDIAKLPSSDPVNQAWKIGVTEQYQQQAQSIEEQRQQNNEDRRNNPLPEPTCGK